MSPTVPSPLLRHEAADILKDAIFNGNDDGSSDGVVDFCSYPRCASGAFLLFVFLKCLEVCMSINMLPILINIHGKYLTIDRK